MPKNINFHFKSPGESPGYLLWQVTMLWQRQVKKALDQLDLTHTQFVLLASLAWLSKSSDTVTQVDIAQQSNTDRMMVSKVLRTLEDKGFITRKEHKTDTRAKTIALTKSGEAVLQPALKMVEQTDVHFFSTLQAQSRSFNAGMQQLIKQHKEEE